MEGFRLTERAECPQQSTHRSLAAAVLPTLPEQSLSPTGVSQVPGPPAGHNGAPNRSPLTSPVQRLGSPVLAQGKAGHSGRTPTARLSPASYQVSTDQHDPGRSLPGCISTQKLKPAVTEGDCPTPADSLGAWGSVTPSWGSHGTESEDSIPETHDPPFSHRHTHHHAHMQCTHAPVCTCVYRARVCLRVHVYSSHTRRHTAHTLTRAHIQHTCVPHSCT